MSLTKDGFFKQVDHKTGDDKYALLGAGGHKEWSTSNTANTLVARDANKDIYIRYAYATLFNSSTGDLGTTAFDRVYVSNDSYIRWKSKSNFGAELRDSGTLDGRWVLKSGDTMTGALNIKGNGSTRANLNLVSSGNVPNDLYFGSNNSSHWSISSRESGNPYIGLYNVSQGWAIKVNYDNNYVGIGTTSPSYKLHVDGDSYSTGWSRAGSGFYCEDNGVHFTHQGSIGEIDMTSNNEFLWGSSGSTLYFNYRTVSRGTTVTNYIWNAGSSSSWANHNMGNIWLNGSGVYLRLGPQNSSYAHYETNASVAHWFNKRIDVDGAIMRYGTNYGIASNGRFYALAMYANRAGGSTYGGISLYSDSDPMTYGIAFRTTGTGTGEGGKLGRVQSDWATYFTMSDTAQRGWIFRSGSTNYASISARGEGYFSAIGNNQYISYPNGGTCTGNNDGTKGAIKIALPTTAYKSSTMLKFTVEIYNYSAGTSSTYIISGYNYENGNWYNVSAYSLRQSTSGYGNLRVRFGIDSDSTRNVVWIGEPVSDPSNGLTQTTWSYPQVYVKNVTLGHSNQDYNKWASGWSVSFVTTLGGTVQTYIDNPATNYITSYANLLYPTFPDTTTTSRSTWNIPSGCRQVWGQRFSDNTLKYTPSGGSATTITDTGDWIIWLAPNATSNVATLNMRIDGIYYGSFSGDLSGNATTATSAYNITVTNNTSSNANYPIVWSNQNNTNNANANQLHKSYSEFVYNPSIKILSVNKINLNREGSTAYGRIYYYKANFYTWVDYMSNSVAGAAPTGGQPSTTTEVTSWAKRSLIENQSGYGWVWEACANSAASATSTKPTARMSLSSNTGQLRIEANAATSTNNKGCLIVSSVLNGSSGNVSIELWRGTNASWSISNESGDLHIRDNYTTSAQTTFLHDNIKVAFNTGTITAKIIQPFTTNEYTLGTGSYRWKALYIGTSDSYGSTTQPIYWNAGVPKACTYELKATINGGTANRLAYYSGANTISSHTNLIISTAVTYGSRSFTPLLRVNGTLYADSQIESGNYFLVNKESTGASFYLYTNNIQYGRLYTNVVGVAGTNTTTYTNPNNSSETKPGYSGAVTGQTILEIGNSKAAGYNGSSYSSPGSAGTANNAQGYLRLYSSGTTYGELTGYGSWAHANSGLSIRDNAVGIMFRPTSSSYYTHFDYETSGNEALVMATQNSVTSFIFVNGESYANVASDRWTKLTGADGAGPAPGLQIKQNCVRIGGLWGSGTNADYKLRVDGNTFINGVMYVTDFPGTWVSGMSTNPRIWFNKGNKLPDTGNYHAFWAMKDYSGNVINFGGLHNRIGFYGYYAARTENNYDWCFTVDMTNGTWTSTKNIGAAGFVKTGSSSSYVLLGNGGHKLISDFATSDHPHSYITSAGFSSNGSTSLSTWGTLKTANDYTGILNIGESNGGAWEIAAKGGQISMQIDGYYYQNEGTYRVTDVSETVTNLYTSGTKLYWTKNGSDTGLTIPYATNAGNAANADNAKTLDALISIDTSSSYKNKYKKIGSYTISSRYRSINGVIFYKSIIATSNNVARSGYVYLYAYQQEALGSSAAITFTQTGDSGRPTFHVVETVTSTGTTIDLYAKIDILWHGISFTLVSGDFPLSVGDWYDDLPTGTRTITPSFTARVGYADRLTTARTIWGQSFDGSADVNSNMSDVGNISFSASGKNIGSILYFDTTNSRLGVGTSSPSYKFHVVGDIYTTTGFKKKDSSDSYVLLGGGGHIEISTLTTSLTQRTLTIGGNNYSVNSPYTSNINLDSVYVKKSGDTMTGTISGADDSYGGGGFHNGYVNIILRGNATTGTSGIVFSSSKGDTSINRPSDCAFIQYHPYGVSAATAVGTNPTIGTSGETGRFVIGIHNDSGDQLWLQTSAANDLKHVVGANVYTIYDSGNLPAFVTAVGNGTGSYINQLYYTKNGSNNYFTVNYASTSEFLLKRSTAKESAGVQFIVGQIATATSATNDKAYKGSSKDFKVLSFPDGGTGINNAGTSNETANISIFRIAWGTSYWHDLHFSPNVNSIYHRTVQSTTANDWRILVETDGNKGNSITPVYIEGGLVKECTPYANASVASAGNADTVDGYHASSFATSGHDHDGRYARTHWSFASESDNANTTCTDLGTWVSRLSAVGGVSNYGSISSGAWWWVRSTDLQVNGWNIRTAGAMIIYCGDNDFSSKNYKHFLVLDAYANLYGITSNEESWKYYTKFLNTSNYTDYVYSKSTSDDRYVLKGGDTMTGALTISTASWANQLILNRTSASSTWGPSILFNYDGTKNGSLTMTSNQLYIGDNGNNRYKAWHEGNDGSGSGLDADMTDGLHVHTGRNNEANKIVRTDSYGYIQAGYINSSSGDENNNSNPNRVWGTNGSDSYLRTYKTSALSVGSATNASKVYVTNNSTNTNFPVVFTEANSTNGYSFLYKRYSSILYNPSLDSFMLGEDSVASGAYSFAHGKKAKATNQYAHAEGNDTTASGDSSHAEGYNTTSSGLLSHAEGNSTVSSGDTSHAEGYDTLASGSFAHAEGQSSTASGDDSHAEGYLCVAAGKFAHAEGSATVANGYASHTSGEHTETTNSFEAAFGSWNASTSGSTVFSVGGGTENNRSNLFEIRNNGTILSRNGTILDTYNTSINISGTTVNLKIGGTTTSFSIGGGSSITHKRKNNANKKYVLGYAATESTSASQPNDNSTMSEVWTDSTFYFTNAGAYHSSDARKKYDIRDILNDDVNKLFETENGFVRHFKWINSNNDAYGFIAQELQEYCPEAVDFNNDTGYYSVNYNVAFSKIIGAMFKKIKELERKLQEKENH